ncbi:hypothetical protein K505DRAFT_334464 [Melanomma pulvis-pyrius CBS 109.77]|uniref:F-box domain-containing protein n=1 Tax=Melanomma pulvis-pyrius CBS 109.77 TaxID=1314802 RepID=A0A6A6XL80_9PLEO|nr:hypothetical protein K505DRAFT_334464 [Melanomma pulvis-pyrius CBS 109.77]
MSHSKFDISTLPSRIIQVICVHLNGPSVLALRFTNRTLHKKTKKPFAALFASIKISLTPRSVAVLEALSNQKYIATKIEHITIGTEMLNQYMIPMKEMQGNEEVVREYCRQFEAGLEEENEARAVTINALKYSFLRMENLKDVRVEDRPALYPSEHIERSQDYRSFMGSSHIVRLTNLDFRWNGPYAKATHNSNHDPSNPTMAPKVQDTFPQWSRQYTFVVIFIVLRDLRIIGRNLALDMKLGGYEKLVGDEIAAFSEPFDLTKRMVADALKNHARVLEFRDIDTNMGWVQGLLLQMDRNNAG